MAHNWLLFIVLFIFNKPTPWSLDPKDHVPWIPRTMLLVCWSEGDTFLHHGEHEHCNFLQSIPFTTHTLQNHTKSICLISTWNISLHLTGCKTQQSSISVRYEQERETLPSCCKYLRECLTRLVPTNSWGKYLALLNTEHVHCIAGKMTVTVFHWPPVCLPHPPALLPELLPLSKL